MTITSKMTIHQEVIVGEYDNHAMICIRGKLTRMEIVPEEDSSFYNFTKCGEVLYAVGYAAAYCGGYYDGFIGSFINGKLVNTRRYSNSKYTVFTDVKFDGQTVEACGLMIVENRERRFSLKLDKHLNILSRRIED